LTEAVENLGALARLSVLQPPTYAALDGNAAELRLLLESLSPG